MAGYGWDDAQPAMPAGARRQRALGWLSAPGSAVARVRSARPPKWWQEIGAIAIVYVLYSMVRNAVPSHPTVALGRATDVLTLERALHINIEMTVNGIVIRHSVLAYICDYYYATLHFVVTIGVLVWLYRRHPLRYRSIRSVLLLTNLAALLGFWAYALAPPRMFAGYADTVVQFRTWGSLANPDLAKASNQFAAMPSLHIGWSLWCAFAIVTLAERRWVRVLGALYPLATLFVILGTANHYVLDAFGGAAALVVGIVGQRFLSGRRAYARPRRVVALPERPDTGLAAA